jgi:hypothetical protein
MEFCDMECKYAAWPKEDSVDGSGSCRTFQALYCREKKQLVFKNQACPDKITKKEKAGHRL